MSERRDDTPKRYVAPNVPWHSESKTIWYVVEPREGGPVASFHSHAEAEAEAGRLNADDLHQRQHATRS